MLLNASEIFNPNAQARTILLAIEDVTDRKQAEEALQTTNAELQHFAYALTHDLQEPLRMVVNFTQLLAEEYDGQAGQRRGQIHLLFRAGGPEDRGVAESSAGLLGGQRAGTGTVSASIDCGAVLAKTLFNLQAAIEESGAMVTSDPLPTVAAEEVLLMQLFQNLISNSIKYRGKERPRIHVSAETGRGWLAVCSPRQRHRHRSRKRRAGIRHVQTPARKRNSRDGNRSGDLQESGRAPGWTNLGGIGTRAGLHIQVHHPLPGARS